MYFPDITTLLATTTAPIASVFTWALPAIGALIALVVAGLGAAKVRHAVVGAIKNAFSMGKRRGRGRRR